MKRYYYEQRRKRIERWKALMRRYGRNNYYNPWVDAPQGAGPNNVFFAPIFNQGDEHYPRSKMRHTLFRY